MASLPPPPLTIEVLLCDACRCPIASIKDVLPSEENAPAWKEHVYSYELDLFSSDDNNSSSSANATSDKTTTRTAPPIQAYSATNPSKRRFDLLRLAPYVTLPPSQVSQRGGDTASAAEACQAEVNASTPAPIGPPETSSSSSSIRNDGTKETTGNEHHESSTATATTTGAMTRVPAFVECDTSAYSTEHSFFVGYAWCFCHCGNCGAFLGWGFAAEDRLRAALREQQQQQQEEKEEEKKKTMKEKTAQEDAVGRLVGGDGSSSANSDPSNGPHGGVDVRVASRRRIERDRRDGSTDLETVQADETDTAEAVESRRGADGASTSPHPGQQGQNYEEEENEEEQDEEEEDDASLPSSRSSRSGGDIHADTFTFKGTAVSPDFIGIIITHCTGEAHYPTSTLLDEAMLRPFRVRRRKLVQHLLRQLRRVLVDMADGYRAHQLHYASEMVVARLFEQPPSPEISAVEATASQQQQQQQGEVELVYDDLTVQYLRDLLHLARTALHDERGGHSIDDGASAHEEEDEEEESDTDGL